MAEKPQRAAVYARISDDRDSDLDPRDYVASLRGLRDRLAELDAAMREFEQPTVSDLGPDALAVWRDGTFEERREILEAVVGQVVLRLIGKVGPARARAMVPETTEIIPA